MPSRKITDLDPISSVASEDLILIRELVAGYDRNMSVSQLAAKLTAVKNTGLTITGFIVSTTTLSVTSNGTNFVKSGDNGNLGASDSEFLSIEFIQCFLNGVALIKGTEMIWISSTSFSISVDLDLGDKLIVLS